ncbi:hypothetical protein ACFXPT_39510 [Streptomyces goshikiensis]
MLVEFVVDAGGLAALVALVFVVGLLVSGFLDRVLGLSSWQVAAVVV